MPKIIEIWDRKVIIKLRNFILDRISNIDNAFKIIDYDNKNQICS